MNLDDLINAADPAREREFTGGSVDDARRLIDQLAANAMPATHGRLRWRWRLRPGSRRTRWRPFAARAAGIVVPVCGIVVAVLIVGLAGLLRHDNHRIHSSTAPNQAASHHNPARLPRTVALGPDVRIDRALINELGVLREPQTAAARTFNTSPKLGPRIAQHLPFVAGLTRAIQLPHRVIFYLYVAERSVVDLPSRRRSVRSGGLGILLRAPYEGFAECCITPQALSRPVGPQAEPYTMSQKPDWLYVELVPDQVATVRWTFTILPTNSRANPSTRGSTVIVSVHHNIAAIALPNRGSTRTDAWYNARGQPIAQHTN